MTVEKLIKDGNVAVVYSPGFGAGWSTWNDEVAEELTFDREIAEAVLIENFELAVEVAKRKYDKDGHLYVGGGNHLEVEWLPIGTQFEITEYDGSEEVRVFEKMPGFTA